MASKLHDAQIHSIQIGDPDSPLRFTVGQRLVSGNREVTITRIERNENHLFDGNGVPVYEVYAKDGDVEKLLKYFERHKVYVSCAL